MLYAPSHVAARGGSPRLAANAHVLTVVLDLASMR